MIKNIQISNFQSHKNTYLEFDKGLNTIIGQSDSGKTAILRALNWVINNKPAGDGFRSLWGGDTNINIGLENANVQRVKSENDNLYWLGQKKYESFNQGVPEEIKQVLNFSKLNIQYQMDAPFLLSESSGEVAKTLNKVVKLDQIDTTLSKIEKRKRKTNEIIQNLKSNIEIFISNLKTYDFIEKMEKDIEQIELFCIEKEEFKDKFSVLSQTITRIENLNVKINKTEYYLSAEKQIDNLISIEKTIKTLDNKIENLNNKINLIIQIRNKIKKNNEILKNESSVNSLLVLLNKIEVIEDNISFLENNISKIENILIKIENNNIHITKKQKEFDKLMPDICLLCGQEIKKQKK